MCHKDFPGQDALLIHFESHNNPTLNSASVSGEDESALVGQNMGHPADEKSEPPLIHVDESLIPSSAEPAQRSPDATTGNETPLETVPDICIESEAVPESFQCDAAQVVDEKQASMPESIEAASGHDDGTFDVDEEPAKRGNDTGYPDSPRYATGGAADDIALGGELQSDQHAVDSISGVRDEVEQEFLEDDVAANLHSSLNSAEIDGSDCMAAVTESGNVEVFPDEGDGIPRSRAKIVDASRQHTM